MSSLTVTSSASPPRPEAKRSHGAQLTADGQPTTLPSSIIHASNIPTSNDIEAWWEDCGPLFGRFLQAGKYTLRQQFQYLLFLRNHLIPALGPHPQKWRSTITRSGLPIEYSINFQTDGQPTLRIGFEPVGILSGTAGDRYNQLAPADLASVLGKLPLLANFDARLYHHFTNDFALSRADEASLRQQDVTPEKGHVVSQAAFGFDLKGDRVAIKGYVFCGRKALATHTPVGEFIASSVAPITPLTGSCAAFALVHDYMTDTSGYNEFTFLSWDCVERTQSRLKLYGVHNEVTPRKLAEMWTLGGRLEGIPEIMQGLQLALQLWAALGLDEADDCAYTGRFDDGVTSGECEVSSPILWNFEFNPGQRYPLPKAYFPIHGRQSDRHVAGALEAFFGKLAWKELAGGYTKMVEGLYPDRDISQTSRLQSWLSFAYTEKSGPYMSVYYHSSEAYPWTD
ncbi:aromatic prenyl-transferase [Aspergillus steynii IBT 23096]|uniref:Aromatic prenyl-transferase n=1 Tax=Aspergillus steynii IBT 23096 TaxID=1392250 RepID=A0A2I2GSP7_9EURO|nr:aromatic prenyl-transferase [Aspergillus steynii IBT 23096]PLB55896.1 aromatic prenyl-transferase [Aspergillus steynii IBT 23096]